jgi:predicted HAD superfamily phosphohydrolase YqeG
MWMEEGEFKNRINQIVHLKIENDDAHCVTCGVKYDPKLKPQNYMISSEGMKNWIDEAKQEFPAWYVVSLPECEGRIYKWDEMTEEQRKKAKVKTVDVDETVAWYVKWLFGGEKE